VTADRRLLGGHEVEQLHAKITFGSCIEQVQFSRGVSHAAEGRAWELGLLCTST